ncbi:MAG TPA: cbb3-type cytochrome c oxidase subunit I [Acidimicrobiales bacterium]|nr:cbb3-type cytochrome c oxidase subunit I [Acidimicrobiales bacterium]
MTTLVDRPAVVADAPLSRRTGLWDWLTTTDHKRIAALTLTTGLVIFLVAGCFALVMRAQLALPQQHLIGNQLYDELFTLHGSAMIFLVVTPLAIAAGVYLVPLQIGAPGIAAPRLVLFGHWLYTAGAVVLLCSILPEHAASDGWYAYTPLSDSRFTPGIGMDLWLLGAFLAVTSMMLMGGAVLWTVVRMRAPTMTLLRMPVFTWSMVVTCLMTVASFPALLAADVLIVVGRAFPQVFSHNVWNLGYQDLFWFYGHPVVYVMFFPFVGAVAETISTFAGRRFVGYKPTVVSLLVFAALSMAVWGHHMFTTGQEVDDYYSLTSILLSVPAGIEYFGFLSTLSGGRLVYPTAMLFALAFIPQFLVGGLTGIMLGTPVLDYHVHGTYFVVAHFHYTLLAGSMFGFFAGVFLWFPKVTGAFLREGLGKLQFWLMVVGTNVTFFPMFIAGFMGLPRREATFPATFGALNLTETIGSGILALGVAVFVINVVESLVHRRAAGEDPWQGHTLEWATTSPPPRFNFDAAHPIPVVSSYAPLLDHRLRSAASAAPSQEGAG